jgi:hypothetical protein
MKSRSSARAAARMPSPTVRRTALDRRRHGEMRVLRAVVALNLAWIDRPVFSARIVEQHARAGAALPVDKDSRRRAAESASCPSALRVALWHDQPLRAVDESRAARRGCSCSWPTCAEHSRRCTRPSPRRAGGCRRDAPRCAASASSPLTLPTWLDARRKRGVLAAAQAGRRARSSVMSWLPMAHDRVVDGARRAQQIHCHPLAGVMSFGEARDRHDAVGFDQRHHAHRRRPPAVWLRRGHRLCPNATRRNSSSPIGESTLRVSTASSCGQFGRQLPLPAVEQRAYDDVEGHRRRNGIARDASDGRAHTPRPGSPGCPGRMAMPCTQSCAQLRDDRRGKIFRTGRRAGIDDDQIVDPPAPVRLTALIAARSSRSMGSRVTDRAGFLRQRAQHQRVVLDDVARLERRARVSPARCRWG